MVVSHHPKTNISLNVPDCVKLEKIRSLCKLFMSDKLKGKS